MAKAVLSHYVKKIEAKYLLAKEKYMSIVDQINKENERYNNLNKANYSAQGITALRAELEQKTMSLRAEMDAIRAQFEIDAREIVKESDKIFNRRFSYTPADIDNNGITILEKGNLSDTEVMQMADNYLQAGNSTMYFLCAERLKASEDANCRSYYGRANTMRNEREDHKIFDEIINICSAGLRTETTMSHDLKDAIQAGNIIDNNRGAYLHDVVTKAESITVEVANPWE